MLDLLLFTILFGIKKPNILVELAIVIAINVCFNIAEIVGSGFWIVVLVSVVSFY